MIWTGVAEDSTVPAFVSTFERNVCLRVLVTPQALGVVVAKRFSSVMLAAGAYRSDTKFTRDRPNGQQLLLAAPAIARISVAILQCTHFSQFICRPERTMAEEQTLLQWSSKQPDWMQDALRRHASAPSFVLDADNKAAILARVRSVAGMEQPEALECIGLSAEHLKADQTDSRTLLCSIGPVSRLGRLAADQRVSFATDGITLIYGDNGSGKTGYCRIAKKVCRSPTSDPLLGNIFEAGTKSPAEAILRFLPPGANEVAEVAWTDGSVAPDELANISVFDSKNARLYIDDRNKFGFLPADIAILERHASHRRDMDKIFDGELKDLGLRLRVQLPTGFTVGGTIEAEISKFASKNAEDWPKTEQLQSLAEFAAEDAIEMQDLQARLATNPLEAASRCKRSSSQLGAYQTRLSAIDEGLSTKAADTLRSAIDGHKMATAASSLAAAEMFASEPLGGVGTDPWQLMYRSAEKYVASLGEASLQTHAGAPCALCQQPLSLEGSERLKRFAAFIAGETAKATEAANQVLENIISDLNALDVPTEAQIERDLGEYASIDQTRAKFAEVIVAFCAHASDRKAALLEEARGLTATALDLGPSVADKVKADVAALNFEAVALEDQAAQDASRAADVARLDALKDAQRLKDNLPTFIARLDDLQTKAKLEECKKLVATGPLSTRITNVRRTAVAGGFEERIKKEIADLDLGHIPFAVTDQSENGQSYFEVGLVAPVSADNADILSEGEQRALALACFLGEIGEDTANHGIIVDDPVSSLDHLRIRRVAERLVTEAAKGRQVIIFTHNLLFYNEVADAAARAHPQVPLAKRNVTKSLKAGFGLVSEKDEPWTAQKVAERVTRLRLRAAELAKETDFDTDDYRRRAKDFYTDLRETWERLVEEVLLYNTVERFSSDVKTMRLKGVVIEDDDYKKVFWAMKRVSERSGHDMAVAKNVPIPTPEDMKKDVEELDTYRAAVKKRADKAGKDREALEKAPGGTVL